MSIVAPAFVHDSIDWTTVFFQRVTRDGVPSRANSAFEFIQDSHSTISSVEYVQNEFAPNGEYGFGKDGTALNLWMRYFGAYFHGGVAIIVGYLPTDRYLNDTTKHHTGIYAQMRVPYTGYPDSAEAYFKGTGGTEVGAESYKFSYPYPNFNTGIDKSLVNRPQFRTMTLVKSSLGHCAFGVGHPDYTSRDQRVWTYTDCGPIDYNATVSVRQDKSLVVRSAYTGLLVSFVEIKVQTGYPAAVFDFSYPGEYVEPETPWWGQKRLTTESATRGRILDRRGFPI